MMPLYQGRYMPGGNAQGTSPAYARPLTVAPLDVGSNRPYGMSSITGEDVRQSQVGYTGDPEYEYWKNMWRQQRQRQEEEYRVRREYAKQVAEQQRAVNPAFSGRSTLPQAQTWTPPSTMARSAFPETRIGYAYTNPSYYGTPANDPIDRRGYGQIGVASVAAPYPRLGQGQREGMPVSHEMTPNRDPNWWQKYQGPVIGL